jgi:hypothetical protein
MRNQRRDGTSDALGTRPHRWQRYVTQVHPRTNPANGAISLLTAQLKGTTLQGRGHDRQLEGVWDGFMGFVVGAIYVHPALLEQRLEDTEILAQMAERGGEWNTHGLDSGPMAGANAQAEASWGELGDDLGLLHHHQGMTWEGRYDRGPQLGVACAAPRQQRG